MTFMARPTFYKGIAMRSRLEAGFAQWVDNEIANGEWNGQSVVYEPCAYADESGQYLPDFEDRGSFFEIKPANVGLAGRIEAMTKMHIIRASVPSSVLHLVIGEWLPDEGRHDFDIYDQYCFGPEAPEWASVCSVCDPARFMRSWEWQQAHA